MAKGIWMLMLAALLSASCKSAKNDDKTKATAKDIASAINHVKTPLLVKVLPTTDGIEDDSVVKAFKYPDSIWVDDAPGKELAAFGAAYDVWLGAQGWTGKGAMGADGNVAVELFPPGAEDLSGPHISYYYVPACVGCILSSAAEYFPGAMEEYNKEYNQDNKSPIKIPDSIKITHLSPSVIMYTLPSKNGLLTQGLAHYEGTENYFEATFVLPTQQSALSDFLMHYYIAEIKEQIKKDGTPD